MIPTYDAAAALQDDANALKFPIRLPALPEGWQSNSGTRSGIEAGRTDPATGGRQRAIVARVGYIAPSKMYVSLSQSDADEIALVREALPPVPSALVEPWTWPPVKAA